MLVTDLQSELVTDQFGAGDVDDGPRPVNHHLLGQLVRLLVAVGFEGVEVNVEGLEAHAFQVLDERRPLALRDEFLPLVAELGKFLVPENPIGIPPEVGGMENLLIGAVLEVELGGVIPRQFVVRVDNFGRDRDSGVIPHIQRIVWHQIPPQVLTPLSWN